MCYIKLGKLTKGERARYSNVEVDVPHINWFPDS